MASDFLRLCKYFAQYYTIIVGLFKKNCYICLFDKLYLIGK